MNIFRFENFDGIAVDKLAVLIADFRVVLSGFKGIRVLPDIDGAKAELSEYISAKYPIFIAEEHGNYVGYVICRIEGTILWVEQLYVSDSYRRRGIASDLFERAEDIAKEMGEETVFNYVHPNNEAVIEFLRSKGYTVLNLIEIRKPYRDEKLTMKIKVNNCIFDY